MTFVLFASGENRPPTPPSPRRLSRARAPLRYSENHAVPACGGHHLLTSPAHTAPTALEGRHTQQPTPRSTKVHPLQPPWRRHLHLEDQTQITLPRRIGSNRCGVAMNHCGHLIGERLLRCSLMWRRFVQLKQRVDLLERSQAEPQQPIPHIGIIGLKPELAELVGARPLRVKPHCSCSGFPKLCAITFREQRPCQPKRRGACSASNKVNACRDVAPLVATTHLQFNIVLACRWRKSFACNNM